MESSQLFSGMLWADGQSRWLILAAPGHPNPRQLPTAGPRPPVGLRTIPQITESGEHSDQPECGEFVLTQCKSILGPLYLSLKLRDLAFHQSLTPFLDFRVLRLQPKVLLTS